MNGLNDRFRPKAVIRGTSGLRFEERCNAVRVKNLYSWMEEAMSRIFQRITIGVCACSLGLFTAYAQSQGSGVPPELAAKIAEIGRVIDPPKSAPLYIPLQEKEPYAGVK